MRSLAERYVTLVLGVGQHDPDYVDAYYGNPALRPTGPTTIDGLLAETSDLDWALAREPARIDLDRRRVTFLQRQVAAVETRLLMLQGQRFPFDDESRRLYDVVAPRRDEDHFAALHRELDPLVPGAGSLGPRYDALRRRHLVPADRLPAVFDAALAECQRRTRARLTLPAGEQFRVEYVTAQPWTAYNWYQGGLASLIQVNTDLPVTVDRVLHLAAHEGYPGHHVFNVLLEDRLVQKRGCLELTVYPLFSPQSLIAEGTADLGVELTFPPAEHVAFQRDVLYPLAGLHANTAEPFMAVQRMVLQLQAAGVEAARRYLDGEIDRDAAIGWLTEWALMPQAQAEQRLRFIERYRSYVITYVAGLDLCRSWVGRRPDPWSAFESLLTSLRTPSELA